MRPGYRDPLRRYLNRSPPLMGALKNALEVRDNRTAAEISCSTRCPRSILLAIPSKPAQNRMRGKRMVARVVIATLISLCLTLGATTLGRSAFAQSAQEIHISCVDQLNDDNLDKSKKSSIAVGTVVGFVAGGVAGEGDPTIVLVGTYVGCQAGNAFAAAFKTDKEKAMVLLNPYLYAFVKSNAGQTLIVYAGEVGKSAQESMRAEAEEASKTSNLAKATISAVVDKDGIVHPIGSATAAALASQGLDPKTAATIGIIVDPGGAVAAGAKEAFDKNNFTKRKGKGCFGYC